MAKPKITFIATRTTRFSGDVPITYPMVSASLKPGDTVIIAVMPAGCRPSNIKLTYYVPGPADEIHLTGVEKSGTIKELFGYGDFITERCRKLANAILAARFDRGCL